MRLAEASPRSSRQWLALLLAAALGCGDDGSGPTETQTGMDPGTEAPPDGASNGEARCVADETRPCGSGGCAGVERCVVGPSGVAAWQACDVSGAFTDPAMLAAVRGQLRGAGEGPLFEIAARQITSLRAPEAGISSVEGIQCLSSLTLAELFSNSIVDVTPFAELTQLRDLILQDNAIVDVAPLAGLTGLQSLLLHINQISDVTPLSGLTGLRQLSLDENQLSDITPLSGLTQLEQLYLGSNQLSDITPLAPLRRLTLLQLTDNSIVDLSPLAEHTTLVSLLAEGNQLSDITPLVGLPALQSVALERNPLDCAAESVTELRMRLMFFTSDCP